MFNFLKRRKESESNSPLSEIIISRARAYGISGTPKRLLQGKDLVSEFDANGTKYVIFKPSDVLNIERGDTLRHLEIAFGLGETAGDVKSAFGKIADQLSTLVTENDAKKKNEAFLNALGIAHSFSGTLFNDDLGTLRHGAALYICTLFILPAGADLTKKWSFEAADKVINDWKKENIALHDFFLLAKVLCEGSRKTTEQYFQEMKSEQ